MLKSGTLYISEEPEMCVRLLSYPAFKGYTINGVEVQTQKQLIKVVSEAPGFKDVERWTKILTTYLSISNAISFGKTEEFIDSDLFSNTPPGGWFGLELEKGQKNIIVRLVSPMQVQPYGHGCCVISKHWLKATFGGDIIRPVFANFEIKHKRRR